MPIFNSELTVTNPQLLLRLQYVKKYLIKDNVIINTEEVMKKQKNKEKQILSMFPTEEISKLRLQLDYNDKLKKQQSKERSININIKTDHSNNKTIVDYLFINSAEYISKIKAKAKEIIQMFPTK